MDFTYKINQMNELTILGVILGAAGMIFAFSDWIRKQDRGQK